MEKLFVIDTKQDSGQKFVPDCFESSDNDFIGLPNEVMLRENSSCSDMRPFLCSLVDLPLLVSLDSEEIVSSVHYSLSGTLKCYRVTETIKFVSYFIVSDSSEIGVSHYNGRILSKESSSSSLIHFAARFIHFSVI